MSDQSVQLAHDAMARQRGVGYESQALAREVVDDGQDTEAAPVRERVRDEVQRPALVPILRHGCWGSRPERALATAPFTDDKPLLPVDPTELLVVHSEALAPEQQVQTSVAEPAALSRQCFQARAQHTVIIASPIAVDLWRKPDQGTRTALRVVLLFDRSSRPFSSRRASEVFCQQLFQRRIVEQLLGQKLLQLAVLILERLEALCLRHLEPAVLRFPRVECR